METIKNSDWFRKEVAPFLEGYTLEYRFFNEGDFGSLDQVIFESGKKGGNIDFWGLGWLGILVYDYEMEEVLLNVLFNTEEYLEKDRAFDDLQRLLGINNY